MSKREEFRERRRRAARRRQLSFLAIVGGLAVLVAAFIIYQNTRPVGAIVSITPVAVPSPNGREMGDPNAPVVMDIYSDFQCPYCAVFAGDAKPQIVEKYVTTGKVRLIYRNFVIIGPESLEAARASMCAAEQERFWDYHDMLFANHTGENVGDYAERRLIAFADALGLDQGRFRACLSSGKYDDQISEDKALGQALGISSTPSFGINGQLFKGALPFSEFEKVIEAELAKIGS
jgi:protein-disulfide isomerase